MSTDYLVGHALKNVWCTPDQDNQIIFKLARLTPYNGVSRSWKILMTSLNVPILGVHYHLFQIGLVHPTLVNLFPRMDTWTKLSVSCALTKTIADLYYNNGLKLSLTESYYIVTEERNVIIAVKESREVVCKGGPRIDYGTDDVYLHLYQNAFFESKRHQLHLDKISVVGGVMKSTDDLIDLQVDYNAKKLLKGMVYAFRNGYLVKDVSLITCKAGDLVEVVHDTSIYKVVDLPLNQLKTFNSTLDKRGKYLLHYQGAGPATIDYCDDVECFLINTPTGEGVYLHKNAQDALRGLTHRDYSIPVNNVKMMLANHPEVFSFENASIRLLIRSSGYNRPLADEHGRIKELYKLQPDRIERAMLGLDSTVSTWRADALESSAYTDLMGRKSLQITRDRVVQAYGYNAVAKIAAEPVVKTRTLNRVLIADAPYFYTKNSTGFEYNQDGLLQGWYYHASGEQYVCSHSDTKYVEFVHGECSNVIDDHLNIKSVTLEDDYDYRFYICPKYTDAHLEVWTDVTGDDGKYTISGKTATWAVSDTHQTLVRSNKRVLVLKDQFKIEDGLLEFNIYSYRIIDNELVARVLEVPMGELDLFLNGRSIIENLDYFTDGKTVVICNKEYMSSESLQEVVIRFKGLCKKDLSLQDANEFGFVLNGTLSMDKQYDIRDDKVLRIQLDGAIQTKEDLVFNEDTVNFSFLDQTNGKPYQVKEVIVPLKRMTGLDTYDYKARSQSVDTEVSNYLTRVLGSKGSQTLNPINTYYKLYSPFICKVIMDLKSGMLSVDFLRNQYSNNQVMEVLKNHLYLIPLDPIHPDNRPEHQYVIIHPHCFATEVDLDVYQYSFVNRVIMLYAKGLVELSNHARIV